MSERGARWCSLLVIVVQNATLIVVACHSRTLPGPRYLGSVAVALTEVLKALVIVAVGLCTSGTEFLQETWGLLRGKPRWVLMFALPATCYCIHNNLWYVAVTHLDPVTVAVGTQSKVIFAAIFAVLLLQRRLGVARWSAVVLLAAGLMLVESTAPFWPRSSSAAEVGRMGNVQDGPDIERTRGLLALGVLCALSGLAGTLTELLLKDPSISASLWTRNLLMSIFSLPIAVATMWITDSAAIANGHVLVGFGALPASIVCLGALGGVVTSVALRFADNLLKSFAVGMSIALACILASGVLGVRLSLSSGVGATLVTVASTAYYTAGEDATCLSCRRIVHQAAPGEHAALLHGSPQDGQEVVIGSASKLEDCDDV